jgi:hypothetical protein
LNARTALRHDADVLFDWDDPMTYARALDGVDRVYLVTPIMRINYAGLVSDFLDLAAGAGVRHVTYLSAFGSDQAPPDVDIRAVELDLARRGAFTLKEIGQSLEATEGRELRCADAMVLLSGSSPSSTHTSASPKRCGRACSTPWRVCGPQQAANIHAGHPAPRRIAKAR